MASGRPGSFAATRGAHVAIDLLCRLDLLPPAPLPRLCAVSSKRRHSHCVLKRYAREKKKRERNEIPISIGL